MLKSIRNGECVDTPEGDLPSKLKRAIVPARIIMRRFFPAPEIIRASWEITRGTKAGTYSIGKIAEIVLNPTKTTAQKTLELIPTDATKVKIRDIPKLELDFSGAAAWGTKELEFTGNIPAFSIAAGQTMRGKFAVLETFAAPASWKKVPDTLFGISYGTPASITSLKSG